MNATDFAGLFLASRPGNEKKLTRILTGIDPNLDVTQVSLAPHVASDLTSAKRGIRTVLSRRFIVISISLWFCYFAGIAVVYVFQTYFFQTYFPLIVIRSGLTISEAGIIVSVSGIIGIAGSVTLGFLVAAAVRDAAELLDIHVYPLHRPGILVMPGIVPTDPCFRFGLACP